MTHVSHTTYMSDAGNPGFIPPHGNYRELLSYRKAEVVYDLTYRFCQRFLSKTDRTNDQMIHNAEIIFTGRLLTVLFPSMKPRRLLFLLLVCAIVGLSI